MSSMPAPDSDLNGCPPDLQPLSKDYNQSSSNDPKSPDYNPYLTVESAGNGVTVVVIPQT
jgi:hypothetical protein